MKVIKYIIVFAAVIFAQQIIPMNALKNKQEDAARINIQSIDVAKNLGPRSLIIIFDPSHFDMSALQDMLELALNNDIPIIVSEWLLRRRAHNKNTQDALSRWHIYKTKTFKYKDKAGAEKDATPIAVLIPKTAPYESYINLLQSFTVDKNISDGELLLGIKVRNLDPLDAPSDPSASSCTNIKDYLNAILVAHEYLKGSKELPLNRWDIFLMGHGKEEGVIAGMPDQSFQLMLDFLNAGINTRSLFYMTCFSGGAHLKNPYQYEQKKREKDDEDVLRDKDLNYMIISANAFSTETSPPAQKENAFNNYFKILDDYFNKPKSASIADLFKCLGSHWEKTLMETGDLELPTIRFPHKGSFKIVDIGQGAELYKLFRIDDSKIIRNAQTGIIIPEDIKVILVESPYIPISVTIAGSAMPLLLSEDPLQSYFFKTIDAQHMTLTEFLSFINKVKNKIDKNKLSRSGKFYIGTLIINIETITPSTDIGLSISWPNTPVNLNHVIIEYDKDFIKATYEDKYAMFYPHQKMWYVTKDKLIKQHKEFFNREVQEEIRPRSRLSESDNLKWVPPLR